MKHLRSALLILSGAATSIAAQTPPAPQVGGKAPVVAVADLDGKATPIVVTAGKRGAVVEFWATWCEICRALLPEMRAAQAKYGNLVDFYGVDVTVNDPEAHVRKYVAEERPPFVTLYDQTGTAIRAFGAVATSHVVIIDGNGRVAYIGDGSDQKIRAELARLVATK